MSRLRARLRRGWLALPLLAAACGACAQDDALQQLEGAMADYAARASEMLAASESPRERWFAGLMLAGEAMRGDPAQSEARSERARALMEAALADGEDDPTLLFWAILDPPLRETGDGDALAQARLRLAARLQELEPGNAVVWLGTLPPRDTPGAIPAAIESLRKAAAAERFDTHFAGSMRELLAAYARVPPPENWPDTSDLSGWQGVEREDVGVIMAVGVAAAMAMPYLMAIKQWCDAGDGEQPWLDDCRTLAQHMVEDSDSIVPHSLGLALIARLYPQDSAQARAAQVRRRELAWLVERGLQRVGPGQPVPFRVWREAWQAADASELTVARALLAHQGLPAQPPPDFVPGWDRENAQDPGAAR